MRFLFAVLVLSISLFAKSGVAATLDDIRAKGTVTCGVDEQHYGFAYLNEQGQWQGFEVDFCRALATAVFNDPMKSTFVPLNAQTRFTALKNKQIDILLRSTTWTFSRDTSYGFDFPGVTYYDKLGILAHRSIGVKNLNDVKEGNICVAAGTTTLETIQDYIKNAQTALKIKVFNSREGLNNFFFSGQCTLYAADHSALTAIVAAAAPKPEEYVFLDASLSKEPLGPVVREDDREWFDIVKWLVFAVIEAEERGINKANVGTHLQSNSKYIRFMLGADPGVGHALRLKDNWIYNVVRTVGNYGEIFERNIGYLSDLKMQRGQNALWRNGGLIYSMPIR